MKRLGKFLASFVLCQAAGLVGSAFTVGAISAWYATLTRPALVPPSWVFGPVWFTLYTLMAVALYLVWRRGFKKPAQRQALRLFLAQLAVNALWSVLFFGLHSPLAGLIAIVVLLALITATIVRFFPINRRAAYLLVPYLAWVAFATYLNAAIWMLNH